MAFTLAAFMTDDSTYPVGEMVFLAMMQTAENLGHPLPWSVAMRAYPGEPAEVLDVANELEDRGIIKNTSKGFIFIPQCREHGDGKSTD